MIRLTKDGNGKVLSKKTGVEPKNRCRAKKTGVEQKKQVRAKKQV